MQLTTCFIVVGGEHFDMLLLIAEFLRQSYVLQHCIRICDWRIKQLSDCATNLKFSLQRVYLIFELLDLLLIIIDDVLVFEDAFVSVLFIVVQSHRQTIIQSEHINIRLQGSSRLLHIGGRSQWHLGLLDVVLGVKHVRLRNDC